ncbi:ThuA domain-containing protein [Neolewinella antarctica]|uniref:Type 1 glutamine amidotransferase n=1 Tax=Neolewinella antarctica TaxID=442734 RepID=A0ABX0XEN8_9BACT|nr:ThuA domain-containing protein [Neolewinella antarctica]NJC27765.1 type 1 glutamine amidotransferase [Neolewinella antarctica]
MNIRRYPFLLCLLLLPVLMNAQRATFQSDTMMTAKSLLVFTKTATFRHPSITEGVAALYQMSRAQNWTMTVTEDAYHFTDAKLRSYDAVVFLSTTGDILNDEQQDAFVKYVNNGGGFVGIHAASDTEHDWPWYGGLIGGQFKHHPKVQEAHLNVHHETRHPAVAHLGQEWVKEDEWYNFKNPIPNNISVLLDLDESTYEGKQMGGYHPIAWYHYYEGGRVFYTGLGHTAETFVQPDFVTHLREGIRWATGLTDVELAEEWTDLLDPTFSQWDKFIGVPHTSVALPDSVPRSKDGRSGIPLGLNNDPLDVFTMVRQDDEDVLKVTGLVYGGLTSKQEYENYHLQLQFKWDENKYEPRLERKRDNGLLYHCTGKHGAFWNVWMRSLELQIQEGDMGDFYALGGANAYGTSDSTHQKNKGTFIADGDRSGYGGAFNESKLARSVDAELAHGEWNTIELYTIGDRAVHVVNGQVVNAIEGAFENIHGEARPLVRGKLQLQSEAADAYFRRVRIRPLVEFPAAVLAGAGWGD